MFENVFDEPPPSSRSSLSSNTSTSSPGAEATLTRFVPIGTQSQYASTETSNRNNEVDSVHIEFSLLEDLPNSSSSGYIDTNDISRTRYTTELHSHATSLSATASSRNQQRYEQHYILSSPSIPSGETYDREYENFNRNTLVGENNSNRIHHSLEKHKLTSNSAPLESTVTGFWEKVPAAVSSSIVPCQRSLHAGAVWDDMFLVFGGYDGLRRVNDLYAYHFPSHQWQLLQSTSGATSPPSPRDRHVAAVFDNYLYIFGGFDGLARVNGAERKPHPSLFPSECRLYIFPQISTRLIWK